jgi:hypothetical protein
LAFPQFPLLTNLSLFGYYDLAGAHFPPLLTSLNLSRCDDITGAELMGHCHLLNHLHL